MSRTLGSLGFLIGLALSVTAFAESETYHGIRNAKCAENEDAAKSLVFEQLKNGTKLCGEGTPGQSGGWSCHHGVDCPKGKVRCNTQYACAHGTVPPPDTSPAPSPLASSPAPRPSFAAQPAARIAPTLPPPTPTPYPINTPTAAPPAPTSVGATPTAIVAPTAVVSPTANGGAVTITNPGINPIPNPMLTPFRVPVNNPGAMPSSHP
jgi:hypothetical protein